MKIGKKRRAAFLLFLILVISSCDALVYDDRDGCEMGVYVHLYSKTPCQVAPIYPKDITQYAVFVFDERNKLAAVKKGDINELSSTHRVLVPLLSPGMYSTIAWAGITDDFIQSPLYLGETKKEDLLLQLQKSDSTLLSENLHLYHGAGESFLIGLSGAKSYFTETSVNLREYSNRIKVVVEGVTTPEEYFISIESNNGSYTINGGIKANQPINYSSFDRNVEEQAVSETFSTLKLLTGYNSILTIQRGNDILYQEDLLGTLLLKNPMINLACDNDFTVKFKVKESCACYEIWVNDWLIHSYDTELGIE